MSNVKYSFVNEVAVVTGAARGIGKATAFMLVQAGANVALFDRDAAELERTVAQLNNGPGKALAVGCDITEQSQLVSAFERVHNEFGRVDILVNSAGMSARIPAENYTSTDFDRLMSLNVKALFSAMQICAKEWITYKHSGKIVNLASIFGLIADPLSAPYAASKGAVIQLTKTCAVEWAVYGIRVNAVAPGYTYTAMTASTLDSTAGEKILQQVPMQRAATVDEIANAVVFLASDAASFVTGHTLVVDGGRTAL